MFAWWDLERAGAHHDAFAPKDPMKEVFHKQRNVIVDKHAIALFRTSAYTEVVTLDDTHALYIYDRIPNGWYPIPKDSPETNSVWVVRMTVRKR